jgi:hypothetical protein
VVCPAHCTVPYGKFSVPCCKDLTSFVFSGIQGDCKVTTKNGLEQGQILNGGKDVKFLLFLVNLCAQESAFQESSLST